MRCKHTKSDVIDSRKAWSKRADGYNCVKMPEGVICLRRRRCKKCGDVFITHEIVESEYNAIKNETLRQVYSAVLDMYMHD